MTIYEVVIDEVTNGKRFNIDFKKRNLKLGKKYLVKDGEYNDCILMETFPNSIEEFIKNVEDLYASYKYSYPSHKGSNHYKGYFKALKPEEMSMKEIINGSERYLEKAKLECYIFMNILNGLEWNEELLGKWFWQSQTDKDLILLREWF